MIIVTGGAGFIGSCMVRYLNDLGLKNILVVDELDNSEKWKNLVGKKFRDVMDKRDLFSWLLCRESEIKAIIHLGACSDTMETNSAYLLENNYRYSIRLAECALTHGIRFIYASSAATYGDGSKGFVDHHDQLYTLEALNMYGYSKQLFDQWAYEQGVLSKIVGLKFFNVFGPNEHHKGRMASVAAKMVPQILRGEPVRLFKSTEPDKFADGEQKRDFIYVKDAVRMVHAFLENDAGGLYNIGSGVASTWLELVNAIYKALNLPPKIEFIEMPPELKDKYQNYSRANMKKTESVLKEKTECVPLHDAIEDYVNNYLVPGKLW